MVLPPCRARTAWYSASVKVQRAAARSSRTSRRAMSRAPRSSDRRGPDPSRAIRYRRTPRQCRPSPIALRLEPGRDWPREPSTAPGVSGGVTPCRGTPSGANQAPQGTGRQPRSSRRAGRHAIARGERPVSPPPGRTGRGPLVHSQSRARDRHTGTPTRRGRGDGQGLHRDPARR